MLWYIKPHEVVIIHEGQYTLRITLGGPKKWHSCSANISSEVKLLKVWLTFCIYKNKFELHGPIKMHQNM